MMNTMRNTMGKKILEEYYKGMVNAIVCERRKFREIGKGGYWSKNSR